MNSRTLTCFGILLTLAVGCGSDDAKDTGADVGTDADADADADADGGVEECTDQREEIACGEILDDSASASISGTLVNEAGEPYADATVQLCTATQCKPTTTDAAGAWSYSDLEGGCYAIDAHHIEDHTVKVLTFVEIATGESRALSENIVLYDFDQEDEVSGEVTVTTGNLQFSASDEGYSPPFGHDGGTIVESVQVDPAAAGLPFDTITGDVVAMWYLGPWSTELEPGWGITATGIDGISEGDTIQVLSGDYFGMGWDIAGEVTAGAGGAVTLTNEDCGGIHFLSTLVLVKK